MLRRASSSKAMILAMGLAILCLGFSEWPLGARDGRAAAHGHVPRATTLT
jgi:hypothetical protein